MTSYLVMAVVSTLAAMDANWLASYLSGNRLACYQWMAMVRGKVLGMTLNCRLCHTHVLMDGLPCGRDVGRVSLLMESSLTKGTRPRGGSYYNGHAMVEGMGPGHDVKLPLCHTTHGYQWLTVWQRRRESISLLMESSLTKEPDHVVVPTTMVMQW